MLPSKVLVQTAKFHMNKAKQLERQLVLCQQKLKKVETESKSEMDRLREQIAQHKQTAASLTNQLQSGETQPSSES